MRSHQRIWKTMERKRINLLGATGSIGTQVQSVCELHPEITINGAAAAKDYKGLAACARKFNVRTACIADESMYSALKTELADTSVTVKAGMEAVCELAADNDADMTVNSVVGSAGLLPTEAAIKAKIPVALANKETLVAGGAYIMGLAKSNDVPILPIDSEHSAIFQSLMASNRPKEELKKIILTASGGPFYGRTRAELENVTVSQALAHPNWSMGNKITIDSATMMNKGFELIEACHLFGVTPDKVEIVIHRQSIVHSAVEFTDNAVIAQMGVPDMTVPIQLAITYPERYPSTAKPLSLTDIGTLTFAKPDSEVFTPLAAAYRAALCPENTSGAIINAANEILVHRFLSGEIPFIRILDGVASILDRIKPRSSLSIENIIEADRETREITLHE